MSIEKWAAFKHEPKGAAIRLICFPHAGAGAQAYSSWVNSAPPALGIWPLQYPGRYSRLRESPFLSMEALVSELIPLIQELGATPFAFFGHCLGSLVALELSRALRRNGMNQPYLVFFSSIAAPRKGRQKLQSHRLADGEFLKRVQGLGGISPEIAENSELMELILPALRADFQIYETYQFVEDAPLAVPIAIVGAEDDRFIHREQLDEWKGQSAFRPTYIWSKGGHFGILDSVAIFDRVIALLETTRHS